MGRADISLINRQADNDSLMGEIMSKKSKKPNKKSSSQKTPGYSGLNAHQRIGKYLKSPMNQVGATQNDWLRDWLPEHLWLASLDGVPGWDQVNGIFHEFLDALEEVWDDPGTAVGLISDFGRVATAKRTEFKAKYSDLIRIAFFEPFGRIAAYYPECPAYWLLDQSWIEAGGSLNPEIDLKRLERIVEKLYSGRDLIAGHIRILPITRLLKSGKLHFPISFKPQIELFMKYSDGQCSEPEKYEVQQILRTMLNAVLSMGDYYSSKEWPKYFWRHNYDLLTCEPRNERVEAGTVSGTQILEKFQATIETNTKRAIAYLNTLAVRVRCDLYDPSSHEVLLGLFSRLTRLYVTASTRLEFWPADIGGIMLRCMADTAITFLYLMEHASQDEYSYFIRYAEGKEKLLMLHLQDTYPGGSAWDGRTSEEVAQELGGSIAPAFVDIDLANWTTKSVRDLALECDVADLYRLVYDPTSTHLHGNWTSVRTINLTRCRQLLHRFHRLPGWSTPLLYLWIPETAQNIYQRCLERAQKSASFPSLADGLEPLSELLEEKAESPKGG
jgi:hypothetical protein